MATKKRCICELCGKLLVSKTAMRDHLYTHTGEKPFVCTHCGKGFTKKVNLNTHLRIHTGFKPYKCLFCGRTFSDAANKNVHMKKHELNGQFEVFELNEDFKIQSKHCENTKAATEVVLQEIVPGVVDQEVVYKKHTHEEVENGITFVKENLPTTEVVVYPEKETIDYVTNDDACCYDSSDDMPLHKLITFKNKDMDRDWEDSEPDPTCVEMTNVKDDSNSLVEETDPSSSHPTEGVSSTEQADVYPCDECDQLFPSVNKANRHRRHHRKSSECPFCKEKMNFSKVIGHLKFAHSLPMACEECDLICANGYELREHSLTHIPKSEYKHHCKICPEVFYKAYQLQKHNYVHRVGEVCDVCGKKFDHMNAMLRHRKSHDSEKEFECSVCKKMFRTKTTLTIHARSHTGEKPFKCSYCPKSFNASSSLVIHTRGHTGERPFPCYICGKAFVNAEMLKVHLGMTHNTHVLNRDIKNLIKKYPTVDTSELQVSEKKEKPYPCDQCSQGCSSQWNLKIHQRTHSGIRPYKCHHCDKSFNDRVARSNHETKHTGEKPHECDICGKRYAATFALRLHLLAAHKINIKKAK